MLLDWVLLLLSLIVILVGCGLFTNGIEWAGKRLQLAEGAVGSVLAAVGTCLPETMIAVLAIVFGKKGGGGDSVGVGAILGAPLMLSTLAFFVTGISVIYFASRKKRTLEMPINIRVLSRDLRFFFIVFGLSGLATFLPNRPLKIMTAVVLVTLYVLYVKQTFGDSVESEGDEEHLGKLYFAPKQHEPALPPIVAQIAFGLGVLAYGAHLFVGELNSISKATGVDTLILSLIITPIATELPEKFNSIIWIRQKKDTLAIGNVSGAMVFQSSIPTAIGMVFTKWELGKQAWACIGIAIASALVAWAEMTFRKRLSPYSLLLGGVFYIAYLVISLGVLKGR